MFIRISECSSLIEINDLKNSRVWLENTSHARLLRVEASDPFAAKGKYNPLLTVKFSVFENLIEGANLGLGH